VCGSCSGKKFPLLPAGVVDSDDDRAVTVAAGGKAASSATEERVCDGCFNRCCTAVDVAARAAAAWAAEKARAGVAAAPAAATSPTSAGSAPLSGPAAREALLAGATVAPAGRATSTGSAAAGAGGGGGGAMGEVAGGFAGVRAALDDAKVRLAQRGEKLADVEERSAKMADTAAGFAAAAEKLKKQSSGGGGLFGGLW
jgi:hypothetical protein